MDRRQLGIAAEDRAALFLVQNGLEVLVRNYRRRAGELDIVALERGVLVIVEVRFRSRATYGGAAGSVHGLKQARIVRAAQSLLQRHKEWRRLPVRFDVVVIEGSASDGDIRWLRHAFEAR